MSTISSSRRGLRPNRRSSTQRRRLYFLMSMGVEAHGYVCIPPIEETVEAHLCPASAKTLGSDISLTSKPCRMTAHLASKAYSSAGEGASALHAMAVLQVFQTKLLQSLKGGTVSPDTVNGLRAASDFEKLMATNSSLSQSLPLHQSSAHPWFSEPRRGHAFEE